MVTEPKALKHGDIMACAGCGRGIGHDNNPDIDGRMSVSDYELERAIETLQNPCASPTAYARAHETIKRFVLGDEGAKLPPLRTILEAEVTEEALDNLTRKVLTVSKEEIERREAEERQAKAFALRQCFYLPL